MTLWQKFGLTVPIYVTRATARGVIGSFSINAYAGVLIVLLATANAIAWGFVGLVEAVRILA